MAELDTENKEDETMKVITLKIAPAIENGRQIQWDSDDPIPIFLKRENLSWLWINYRGEIELYNSGRLPPNEADC